MRKKNINETKVRSSVESTVTKYADRGPFCLHPDKVLVRNVIAGLVKNKILYGYAYCPCKVVRRVRKKNRDNICPCRTHKEEITRQGTCECGLFVSKAYFNAKKKEEKKN